MKNVKYFFLLAIFVCVVLLSTIILYRNSSFKQQKTQKTSPIYSVQDYIRIAEYFGDRDDFKKSVKFCEKALGLDKDNIVATIRLASAYFNLGQYDKSIDYFKKAYRLRPDAKKLLFGLGEVLYKRRNDVAYAAKFLEEYLKIEDNNYKAYLILYDCYAKLGDFKKMREVQKKRDALFLALGITREIPKEWNGSDPKNKTILLRDNVGIGDIFCWLRYAKKLKEQGAKVILETRAFLIPILEQSGCIDSFVAKGDVLPYFDYQITVGSMPDFFVHSEDDLKTEIPYMKANDRLQKVWDMRFSKEKNFKIGICWEPGKYPSKKGGFMENWRAMPLSFLLPLSRMQNVTLYSLQCVNGMGQLKSLANDFKIRTFGPQFDRLHGSFSDTAAVIKNLDLVITVDTSIAHLAGALGAQVWMLLPLVADWRWLSDEHKTALYPTMRLFRQHELEDWESVVSRVYSELCKIVS